MSAAETPQAPERREARGYSWAPFEVGNDAALVHGARSPRRIAPLAGPLLEQLPKVAPWTASPAFAGARASWAEAEAQAALLRSYLDEHGLLDDDGEERPAARLLDRVEGRLAKLRDQLGLTPAALGGLLRTAAQVATATGDTGSVEALGREGARILASRLTSPPDPAELDAGTPTTEDDR